MKWTHALGLSCAAALIACSVPADPLPPPTPVPTMAQPPADFTPPPVPTLAPPSVIPSPALSGTLWLDFALGDLWKVDLKSGAVATYPVDASLFPAEPALASNGRVAYMASDKTQSGTTAERYGIWVDHGLALGLQGDLSWADPMWAADSKTVYLTRLGLASEEVSRETTGLAVVRARLDADSLRLDPSFVITDGLQPAPSPDGKLLAYVKVTQALTGTKALMLRDLTTGQDRVLITDTRFVDMFGPRWLPDSSAILLSATDQALARRDRETLPLLDALFPPRIAQAHSWVGDIWRIRADGSGLTQLTKNNFQAPIAAASPDGAHIAILSYDGVFVVNADGSKLVRISDDGGNGGLAWAP